VVVAVAVALTRPAAATKAAKGKVEAAAAAKLPADRTPELEVAGTSGSAEAEGKGPPGEEAAKTSSGRGRRWPPPHLRPPVEEGQGAGGGVTAATTTSSNSRSAYATMTTARRRLRPGRSHPPIAGQVIERTPAATADLEGVGAEATVGAVTAEANQNKRNNLEKKTTKGKRSSLRLLPNHPSVAAAAAAAARVVVEAEVDRALRQDGRGFPVGTAGNAAGTNRERLRPVPVRRSQ
jgi:hypothetical protein